MLSTNSFLNTTKLYVVLPPTSRGEAQRADSDLWLEVTRTHVTFNDTPRQKKTHKNIHAIKKKSSYSWAERSVKLMWRKHGWNESDSAPFLTPGRLMLTPSPSPAPSSTRARLPNSVIFLRSRNSCRNHSFNHHLPGTFSAPSAGIKAPNLDVFNVSCWQLKALYVVIPFLTTWRPGW